MTEMTAGDVLVKAIDIFETYGWCRNALRSSDGEYCAVGAVNQVIYGHHYCTTPDVSEQGRVRGRVREEAFGALAAAAMSPVAGIAHYNNTRSSYAEIKEWFEKAAAEAGFTP